MPIRDGRGGKATLVLLVRHGQTATTGHILPGRAPGLHLAPEGRREVEALADRIGRLAAVAAVYTSPLERARETAAAIARARRVVVRVEADLSDCDVGRWTGQPLRALRRTPEWRTIQRYPASFRFPGGESFTEMQTRVTSALARLTARHPGQTIVAVSHADPIKAAVAHALGIHLDLFQRIAVSTGSLTAVAYGPEGPVVVTLNSRAGDAALRLTP
jgi:probable phosphoglycerate mutase